MATFCCPCCGAQIPLSSIPDADLLSERGRRNAAKRKSFGARPKGRAVWRAHSTVAWRCRCATCLTAGVEKLERDLASRVQCYVSAVGSEPDWAPTERERVQSLRAEIEAAIAERRRYWARAAGQDAQEVVDARAA